MTKKTKDIASQDLTGQNLGEAEAAVVVTLQSRGAEGYIALGSILAVAVENDSISELKSRLLSMGAEEHEQVLSHACAIMNEATEKRVQKELNAQKDKTWIEALDGGVKGTLEHHRRSINEDIDHLIENSDRRFKDLDAKIDRIEVNAERRASFLSQAKNGIIAGVALSFVLLVAQFIDNPFADTIRVLTE